MTTVVFTVVASLFAILFSYGIQRYSTSIRYNLSLILYPSRLDRHQTDLAFTARAFEEYSHLAHFELQRMQRAYGTISRQHKRIGFNLGYPHKLDQLQETIKVNTRVTKGIAELARHDVRFPSWGRGPSAASGTQQLGRIREVLKHFVRDWSLEGAGERLKTFPPILDELSRTPLDGRGSKLVLVPGAGLGRLPWEIAQMGYDTTSNEMSPYMNLAFLFLVSRSTTSRCRQHIIHPFAHWFSHQRSDASLFRTVAFPDVLPSLDPVSRLRHDESDFLKLSPVEGGYDYIVTHYFIDTSRNIISTLQKIYSLLKTGGTWINLGPLLWMSGGQATLELSLEEVLNLSEDIGFRISEGNRRTIPSEYTRDNGAMMRWIYETEFWIALKE